MKNHKVIYLLFALFIGMFFGEKIFAQEARAFKFFPKVVKQGDYVTTVYQPSVGSGGVTAVVYLFKNFKWEGHDLPLTKTDSGYVSKFLIPEGTALMSYRYWIADSVDVGGRIPYSFMVHDKSGKSIAPGGSTEWGLFRYQGYDSRLMPIVSKSSAIELRTLIQLWIAKDFNNVEIRRHLFFDIARVLKSYIKVPKVDTGLRQAGDAILNLPDVNEKEMITVEKVYGRILHKQQLADSVKKLIIAKYPDGLRNRLLGIDSIYLERNLENKVKMLETFLLHYPPSKYPFDDYIDPSTGDPGYFYSVYNGVVTYLFTQKQFDKMKVLISDGPYQSLNFDYLHFVDYPYRATTPPITKDEQLDISTFIINNLMERAVSKDLKFSGRGYFSSLEWKRVLIEDNKWSIAYHAGLLYANGKYNESLKYADMIKAFLGYGDIKFNDLYAHLLDHDHKGVEAKSFMLGVIKADKSDPELISLFKGYYVKEHKTDKGFDQYYGTLSPASQTEELHERLKKSLIHIPAAAFNLKNLKGEDVNLENQKGKIVILDFWASWCYPCKQAMPGMQILVKKYKPDTAVQFYFISTLEYSQNYKKLVTDFITAQQYDFNVLYDDTDPNTGKMGLAYGKYAKLLNFNGIPQKIIIDQHGFVRWIAGGYDGDLVALTKEVDYVISLIQQEK